MHVQPRSVLALGVVTLAVSCGRKPQQPAAATATRVLTVEAFKTPESVKYDAQLDLYFVTNINGHPSVKDNNGFISRVRPDGSIESLEFVSGGRAGVVLHAPKGTAIVADTVWVWTSTRCARSTSARGRPSRPWTSAGGAPSSRTTWRAVPAGRAPAPLTG